MGAPEVIEAPAGASANMLDKLPTELVYLIIQHAGVIAHQEGHRDSTKMTRAEQLIPARSSLRLVSHVFKSHIDRIEFRHPDRVIHLGPASGDPIFPVTRHVSDLSSFFFGTHHEAVISDWNRPFDAVKTFDGVQLADRYILPQSVLDAFRASRNNSVERLNLLGVSGHMQGGQGRSQARGRDNPAVLRAMERSWRYHYPSDSPSFSRVILPRLRSITISPTLLELDKGECPSPDCIIAGGCKLGRNLEISDNRLLLKTILESPSLWSGIPICCTLCPNVEDRSRHIELHQMPPELVIHADIHKRPIFVLPAVAEPASPPCAVVAGHPAAEDMEPSRCTKIPSLAYYLISPPDMSLDRLQGHLSDFRAEVFELAARTPISITAYLRSERGGYRDGGDEKEAETAERDRMLISTPTLLAVQPESKVQLLGEDEDTPLCRHCDTAFRLVP